MTAQLREPNTGRAALWACPRDRPGTVFGPAAMRPQPGGEVGEKRDPAGRNWQATDSVVPRQTALMRRAAGG